MHNGTKDNICRSLVQFKLFQAATLPLRSTEIQETLCTFKTKKVALSIAQSGDLQTGQILISLVLTIPMWSASLWTSHNPGSRTGYYIFICLEIKYLKTRKNVVKVPIAPND